MPNFAGMAQQKNTIPIYSLDRFNKTDHKHKPFQVEVFDANRHFEVQYPHRHDFFEILFLTKGSGLHIIDNNQYDIKPPCIFFLSPGQAHKLELSKDVEGYIFLFTSEFYLLNKLNRNRLLELPFFFNIHQENPPLLLKEQQEVTFFSSLFKKGSAEMHNNDTASVEVIYSLLDLILNASNQLYPKDDKAIEKGKGHLLVKRFQQLVEENYHLNLSINQYADKLNITPNHLTQTIKSLTGKTSAEFIQSKVTLEIKRLLIYTDLSSTEIASQLNFKDQSYFTKYFKRITGLTPKEYREKSMKST